MLFTSALWMARTDQMTDDHFFNGFPCEWNMIVPTLYLLHASEWFAAFACVVLCLTQLTNIKFLHPMQVRLFRPVTDQRDRRVAGVGAVHDRPAPGARRCSARCC